MDTLNIPTEPKSVLKGHKGPIYTVKYNTDGGYCMTGSQDKTINLYNPHKGILIKAYTGAHNYEVTDVAISADNGRFGSVGGDKYVILWDVATGNTIRKFYGHNAKVNCVAWNKDCTVLVTGSYDSTIRFWDMRSQTNKELQVCKNFKDSVTRVIVHEEYVFTSSMDGHIRTFDIRMGEILVDNMKQAIGDIALSNDKKCILASCFDSKIRMVSREDGEILNEYTGHKTESYVTGCRFSWDDSLILSGSEDGIIYIYDVLTGKPKLRLKNHLRAISALDMAPKKDTFASASFDGTVTIWTKKI